MNKLLLSSLAGAALLLPDVALAHGGQYRGPGDVVPPNAGGGPSGGGPGGPTTPGSKGPGSAKVGGPTTAGPGAPPPPGGAPAAAANAGPKTRGGIVLTEDLGKWQFWWEFNKDPFINLKDSIHAPDITTGSDEVFLGASRRPASKDTAKPSETDIKGIMQALNRALDSTDNRDIVSSCIVALAKIGQDHDEFKILPIFKSKLIEPDQEIRETAALAMGISGMPSAIPDLVHIATDTPEGRKLVSRPEVDNRTRSFAAYGLGLIAWANNDLDVKRAAFESLNSIMEDEGAKDRNIKVAAINGLSLLNLDLDDQSEKGKKLLEDTLASLDKFYDTAAGRGTDLIKSHVPPAVAKLIGRGNTKLHIDYKEKYLKQLKSPQKQANDIYRADVLALGQLCLPYEDKDSDDAKYSVALKSYFDTGKEEQARSFALLAIGQIGGTANKNELLKVLSKGQKAIERPWAALSLGVMNFQRLEENSNLAVDETIGLSLLRAFENEKSPEPMAAYAIALGLSRYTDASGALLDGLQKHKSKNELAGYICISLALMNHGLARQDIHEIVKKSVRRPALLQQAAVALGKLGDKGVTRTLIEMLEESEQLAKLSAIASALSFIGDRRTIEPLRKMLFDDSLTPLSRAFAAVALGGVADKEKLPWNSKIGINMNYRAAVETLTGSGTGILDIL